MAEPAACSSVYVELLGYMDIDIVIESLRLDLVHSCLHSSSTV